MINYCVIISLNILEKMITKEKLFLLTLVIISGLLFLLYFQFTIDDAYITFRHSLNLVNHGVLSWNIDGPREEAFTNPLFVGLGSIGILAGLKPELPIKIIHIFLIIHWLKRSFDLYCSNGRLLNKLFVASFILLSPLTYIHAFAGLETFIFAYLLFEFINLKSIGQSKSILISSFLLLCRPEGILFLTTSIFRNLVFLFKKSRAKFKTIDFISYIFFIIVVLIYLFKFNYFGDFLPNSYYVKSATTPTLSNIIFQLKGLLPWLVVSLFVIKKPIKGDRLVTIGLILFIAIYYSKSVLMQNYASRYWYQIFFPLIFHEICNNNFYFVQKLFNDISNFKLKKSWQNLTKLFSIFVFVPSLFLSVFHLRSLIDPYYSRFGRIILSHAYGGKTLNKILPVNATLMVGDAGLIPFYTNRFVFDSIGLGTKSIAKSKGVKKSFLKINSPGVVIIYAKNCSPKGSLDWGQSDTLNYLNENNYKFLGGWLATDGLCLNIYSRKDIVDSFDNEIFYKHIDKTLDNYNNHKNSKELFIEVFHEMKFAYKYLFSPLNDYSLQ